MDVFNKELNTKLIGWGKEVRNFLKETIRAILPIHINGRKYNKNGVKVSNKIPLLKAPTLGNIATGRKCL